MLHDLLVAVAATSDSAVPKLKDVFGQRYELRFVMTGPNGKLAEVLSAWIVRADEDFPRLTNFYIKG